MAVVMIALVSMLSAALASAQTTTAYELCDFQPDPEDLYYRYPIQLFCANGRDDDSAGAEYSGLLQCSPHASFTVVYVGNVSHSSGLARNAPLGGPSVQSYNTSSIAGEPMPSKVFLDLQTGVIFNDTESGTGANTVTTELHPESSGSEQVDYMRALQQLILDVSNTASPPAGYERPCNPAHPQLGSTVEYLQKALATVKAQPSAADSAT